MVEAKTRRRLFHLFADLLEYPQSGITESVRECEALVSPGNPEAAALLHGFRSYAEDAPLGQIQELYTRTFDLDATYQPYIGHHLFGESYKRSAFMVGLKERYKVYDFVVENELPDHLAVMLRYLSLCEDDGQVTEIVQDAIAPALERMVKVDAKAEGGARNGGAPNGDASCRCGLDEGAPDVSAMDQGGMDVGALDASAVDVSAMDTGASDDDANARGDLEPGVYPELLHALRLVLQEVSVNDRQPVRNLSL